MSETNDFHGTGDGPEQPDEVAGSAPVAAMRRRPLVRWLLDDSPYITMLLLALAGMVMHMPISYWVYLMPVFCVICIVAGWPNFATRNARLHLIFAMVLSWFALMVAIFLLYNAGVTGVLNSEANVLSLTTLLALGTFVAGVQTRVWRICVVGGVLFLAVPGMGWVDQSAILLALALIVVIAIGGLMWWLQQRRGDHK